MPVAFNELVYEDPMLNCDCNQYLSGIKGTIDPVYHGENDQRRRLYDFQDKLS